MLASEQDDVSNIHRRWSFTRLTPGSLKSSYAMTLACAAAVIVVSHVFHLQTSSSELAFYLPLSLGVLFATTFLDRFLLRGTPVNNLSKIIHVSSFANLLWAITVIMGIAANAVFSKPAYTTDYIITGMMLAAGLRTGIYVSVFGASLYRAIAISFIQPVILLFSFLPPSFHSTVFTPPALVFGSIFMALGVIWAVVTDKAGRPTIKSTFRMLQAFLDAWTENKVDKMENLFEGRSYETNVGTKIIKFSNSQTHAIVLPDVHPGPFGMVGGSYLPYVLYNSFGKKALVMHSVSDHSLNIPSKREVDRYIKSLENMSVQGKGSKCAEPVQIKKANATVTGLAFDRSAIVMLSLAPKGMEDVPQQIRAELESYASSIGFGNLLVVDCHNAMGGHIGKEDESDLLAAAKECLEKLMHMPQYEFEVGFASLDDTSGRPASQSELGQAGLAVMVIKTNGKKYAIGWSDSNNMENKLRDKVISAASGDVLMLEVCSSDTHSTSGKRTREGYFALGMTSNQDKIASVFGSMCEKAAARVSKSGFEVCSAKSTVKVMGQQQFEDYSKALDKTMSVTKLFVGITFAVYVAMLVMVS